MTSAASLVAVPQDCKAFMWDYDICELYSKCEVVNIDGCDDCTVQVCLENCPEDAKPYYVRRADWQDCNSRNRIRSYDTECSVEGGCDDWDREKKVRDGCADRCIETPGCSEFFLPNDHSACELYSDCDLDYHDDGEGEGGFIGIFREDMNRHAICPSCNPCTRLETALPGCCGQL